MNNVPSPSPVPNPNSRDHHRSGGDRVDSPSPRTGESDHDTDSQLGSRSGGFRSYTSRSGSPSPSNLSTAASGGKKVKPPTLLFRSTNTVTNRKAESAPSSGNQFTIMSSASGDPVFVQTSSNTALLYQKKSKERAKRTTEELGQSELFQVFGEKSLSRGAEEADTPLLCLDLAQVDTLEGSIMSNNPSRIQAAPRACTQKYPLHQSTLDILAPPDMDPLFLSAKEDRQTGGNNSLVLSKNGESLDNLLLKVRQAINYNIAATAAMQQGLGRVVKDLQNNTGDPAIILATLNEAFEASMDALEQAGRAAAINHHARRVHVIRDVGLAGSVYETQLTQLPLNPKWLFGAELNDITERIRVRKSAAGTICHNSKKGGNSKGGTPHKQDHNKDHNNHRDHRPNQQQSYKPKANHNNNFNNNKGRHTPYNKPRQQQYGNQTAQPFRQGAGGNSGFAAGKYPNNTNTSGSFNNNYEPKFTR